MCNPNWKLLAFFVFFSEGVFAEIENNTEHDSNIVKFIRPSETLLQNAKDWRPEEDGDIINLPVEECLNAKDVANQKAFADLMYLDMDPPCEKTAKSGYCGIRRYQNITLLSKFLTKNHNDQLRVRVHIVDKYFGWETAVWPEFSVCQQFFNISCPQDQGIAHSLVFSEIPKEIPPTSLIIRVRLMSVNEKKEKNVAICKQIKLDVM